MAHPDSPTQVAQGHLGSFDPGHGNASDVLMFDRTGLGTAAHTLTVLVTGKSSFLSRETTVIYRQSSHLRQLTEHLRRGSSPAITAAGVLPAQQLTA